MKREEWDWPPPRDRYRRRYQTLDVYQPTGWNSPGAKRVAHNRLEFTGREEGCPYLLAGHDHHCQNATRNPADAHVTRFGLAALVSRHPALDISTA
jgi:hypothetical protein